MPQWGQEWGGGNGNNCEYDGYDIGGGGLMLTVMMVVVVVMALRVTSHPPVCPGLSWH